MSAGQQQPERRWMTRSLYDWTDRSEHHNNKYALAEARSVAILEKLRSKAFKRDRSEEADALWDGIWEIKQKLETHRKRVAEDCAPWFDASAFEDCCPKCGGETYTAKYGPESSAGCDTSVRTCRECEWTGDPE